jgi:hypothetical protein
MSGPFVSDDPSNHPVPKAARRVMLPQRGNARMRLAEQADALHSPAESPLGCNDSLGSTGAAIAAAEDPEELIAGWPCA